MKPNRAPRQEPPPSLEPGARRRLAALAVPVAVIAMLIGCVFDPDDRCGPGEEYLASDDVCICEPGAVLDDEVGRCVPCGEHEEVVSGACACVEGYSRLVEGGPCEEVPAGLGASCDPAAAGSCADATYDYCQASGSEGYCTSQGCTTDGDCGPSYACDTAATPATCLRPPVGQGKACETQADCADGEATYCEELIVKLCLVDRCGENGGACHGAYTCCDFTDVGIAVSLCVPPEQLDNGGCPFGATLIPEGG